MSEKLNKIMEIVIFVCTTIMMIAATALFTVLVWLFISYAMG